MPHAPVEVHKIRSTLLAKCDWTPRLCLQQRLPSLAALVIFGSACRPLKVTHGGSANGDSLKIFMLLPAAVASARPAQQRPAQQCYVCKYYFGYYPLLVNLGTSYSCTVTYTVTMQRCKVKFDRASLAFNKGMPIVLVSLHQVSTTNDNCQYACRTRRKPSTNTASSPDQKK